LGAVVDAIGRVDPGSSEDRMQGRGGRLVGLVVGTSLLAACTGGGGDAEEGASEAPSSPSSPVVSSSSEAAVPVLPDEARGDDDAAAVAFVEHWVELVNYALRTGDTAPADAMTTSQCGGCQAALSIIEDEGGSDDPELWVARSLRAAEPADTDFAEADVTVSAEIIIGSGASTPAGTMTVGLVGSGEERRIAWFIAE
jgi:hypothetical protein